MNWNQYQQRRIWLTKFWMGLVVFNALLQLDVVEKWFNSQLQTQNIKTVSQLKCLNYTTLGSHQSEDQFCKKLSKNIVLVSPNPILSGLHSNETIGFQQKNVRIHFPLLRVFQSTNDLTLTSGLSPPQHC